MNVFYPKCCGMSMHAIVRILTDNVSGLLVMTSGGIMSVMNGFLSSYGAPTSPTNSQSFAALNGGAGLDLYSPNSDGLGYVQANSPQPTGFAINFGVSIVLYCIFVYYLIVFLPGLCPGS